MPLFGPPDVAQLTARRDFQGLARALNYADPNIRRAAAAALGETGDARAVDALILALKNPDWEHDPRDTAALADALIRLGLPSVGPLIALLDWHSKVVRVSVAGALAAIGRPSVPPLIDLLGRADLENRETAGQILAEIGPEAVDELIDALNDPLTGKRQWAARVLGDIGDPRAVDPLRRALEDQISGVRQTAARSLGVIADSRAADSLAASLTDPDLGVRRSAALALAEMQDPRAIPRLLPELLRANEQAVVDALVKVGVPTAEPLVVMLADSKARGDEAWMLNALRSTAPTILARIGYPQQVATLLAQLFAEEQEARTAAASQLFLLHSSGELDGPTKALVLAARPYIDQARAEGSPEDGG